MKSNIRMSSFSCNHQRTMKEEGERGGGSVEKKRGKKVLNSGNVRAKANVIAKTLSKRLLSVAILGAMLVLVALLTPHQANASSIREGALGLFRSARNAPTNLELTSAYQQQQQQQPSHSGGQAKWENFVDDVISDMLDEEGERLKKSRTGARQVKNTLRFGRRSDPYMEPSSFSHTIEQQIALDELQRRLLAN